MTLSPGTLLGPYEVLGPLGAGGMGEVYRARDARLGRDVAIKVLPAAMAGNPDRLARFEREARAVAGLNHPNIVTLHSIEESGGTRFLTMELVEGQTLDHVVTTGGLPLARLLDLAIPLADALASAHERGVVHRDLKPANVMLTREGRVKVLDFGLAKLAAQETLDSNAGDATLAMTIESPISAVGQVVGTVPYMAPEQLRGEAVDARTDLFSLGIVLYELATGRRPFVGATSADVGSAILLDTPPTPQSLRADLPPDLNRVISRCLEKDPDRRVQTAKDVRNELELLRRAPEPSAMAAASSVISAPSSEAPATIPVRSQSGVSASASSDRAKELPSIAVLPFVNRSRDEEDEYFSDGLADELMNLLAKIRGLRVAARTSTYHFKGKQEELAVIGQKLNVAALLEGSVRKAGNRVRISVQLVKVADGFQLWSETYDRLLDDIFAVQDDIAQSVVKELRTTLMGEDPDSKASGEAKAAVEAAAKGRAENPEAYRLLLQGRYFLDRFNQEDVARAVDYFEQATVLDPEYAMAWVELARAIGMQAGYSWTPLREGAARARSAIERAIGLDPSLAEAYLLLGSIQVSHYSDRAGARASFDRAMALSAGRSGAIKGAGTLALQLGLLEEAVALNLRSVAEDPLSASAFSSLGAAYRYVDRPVEARAAFQKALELSPQREVTHMLVGLTYYAEGRLEEALVEILREPADVHRLAALAAVYHDLGRQAESDAALSELILRFSENGQYQIAAAHAGRGEADQAFAWLERGREEHDPGLALLKSEPVFRRLRSDPRWSVLLQKLGVGA